MAKVIDLDGRILAGGERNGEEKDGEKRRKANAILRLAQDEPMGRIATSLRSSR